MEEFKEYCNSLGSTNPTPGGGSAAALGLSLGASAAEKAVRFSLNEYLEEFLNSFTEIKEAGFILSEEDQSAFNNWMEARKLPKSTPEEKSIRENKINFFAREAILVPYQIAKRSIRLLEIIQDFIPHCNKWLLSDLAVGGAFAKSSFDGSIFNVYINFPYLKDVELYEEINEFIEERVGYAAKITENIYRLCKINLSKKD
ncbi:MAG TPA: cyclodeaminase/cyclohydrolase family protein [Spirochaetota bacterium]|nr:cyclodeaminase/cyclohydrolase family protein [Spirochaetota bacterium]